MGMLSNSVQDSGLVPKDHDTSSRKSDNTNATNPVPSYASSKSHVTPEDSSSQLSADEFAAWDPLAKGLLKESEAITMLEEFRRDFADYFPFVVVDASMTVDIFRREQPFLFLSIMTTMSYTRPRTQRMLADEFRDQIAARIVSCSLKGLEVLQGLLVHAAYYHYVYRTGKSQVSLIVQLCVATSLDMGLVQKCRGDLVVSTPVVPVGVVRALLGTYYIAAA